MTLTANSTLEEVASVVASALHEHGIRAVLTGGACASLHSGGAVQSYDLDFVLQSATPEQELRKAMASIGFTRRERHFTHPSVKFFVEFPPGPLGIGRDITVRPMSYKTGSASFRTLSPTDSCRDRLAAFYHWNDPQSLNAAVQIALRCKVNMRKIREWSGDERAQDAFAEFMKMVKAARQVAADARPSGNPRLPRG